MATTRKNFYIGERVNPQFKKSYFKAYGKLTKAEAKKKENCAYGSMYVTAYTEDEYNAKLESLKSEGYSIY